MSDKCKDGGLCGVGGYCDDCPFTQDPIASSAEDMVNQPIPEPLSTSYSRSELASDAKHWMTRQYGAPNTLSELADTIEDIGAAMGLLREAVDDTERGNLGGGKMCGSDALEILSNLETRFSQMAAKLAIWSECAVEAYGDDDEHAGKCLDCGASLQLVRPGKHQCPNCG